MIYRAKMDGNDILDYQQKKNALISPSLEMKAGEAGSLEFTMHPSHTFYDDVKRLKSTIEVYENDQWIWTGRPAEVGKDDWNNKRVYCEGALAFFNDSVQRPAVHDSIMLHTFFSNVIATHNSQVAADRRFTVGNVTVANKSVYRKLNYESTFDVLKKMCVGAEGGYLFVRKVNGVHYIDWVASMPYTCNQPVKFGLNLLKYSETQDATGYATCLLPLGAADEETGERLTVSSVNNGSDIVESYAVDYYGKITKVVTFDDIDDPEDLLDAAEDYLLELQYDDAVIECSAAELGYWNDGYDLFKVGQTVRCISTPHLIDKNFPLTKMTINLDTAAKQITLGTATRQTLTEIYKDVQPEENPETEEKLDDLQNQIDDLQDQIDDIVDSGGSGGGSGGDDPGGGGSGGGDGWIHQVDGVTQATGTINFITT